MTELIFICVLATIAGIIFKQSKIVALLLMVLLWVLWGWNYDNGDYYNYEERYRDVIYLMDSDYELGFKLMTLYGQKLGLSFQTFIQCVSFLTIALWGNFVFRITRYPALFFAITLWVFFPLDFVLLRNTLAFAIVMQGLLFIRRNWSYSYIAFVLLVLLASQIHASSYFYLILLGVPIADKISMPTLLSLMGIAMIVCFIGKALITSHLGEVTEGRTEYYESSMGSLILYGAFQIANTYYITRLVDDVVEENSFYAPYQLLKLCNILLLMIIPFYSITAITIRLLRNFVFANTAFLLNILFLKTTPIKYNIIGAAILVIMFLYFVMTVTDDTIAAMFNYNLLFR